MPIANIGSILKHGILCHERAAKLVVKGTSVAMAEVQDARNKVQIPGGLMLHRYANLYFHARNPMMYLRKEQAGELCVLQISTEILKIQDVVLADLNAASPWVRFYAPSQWSELSYDDIFARYWTHSDPATAKRQKLRKCAEVLVPKVAPVTHLLGAYVVDDASAGRLAKAGFKLPVTVNSDIFFH
ncbi:MAG: DUF4433 domain-containing protein [Planctomycetes bacterium]|nr:DUF4433 domain-containing protein [Planctomycetota bacterium]